MFPPSLLARLYVKGSLKNNATGFEMKLKNIIDSGTITGLGALTVDDMTYQPAQVEVKIGDKATTADQITREQPLVARAMLEIFLKVTGAQLTPGPHKITFVIMTREAGKLQFSITEPVAPQG